MHAHDFRSAEEFIGRNLLVVGASYSAEDIGLQCKKYGAKSVTFSYRTAAMGFLWPDGMEERPLLQKLEGKTAHFKDGSTAEVDAIILCTGYQHHFPFMQDSLRLRTRNRLYAPGLYKGVVWADNPKVMYLGMQDQWYTFTMFDAEAWFARDVILGRIELPAKAEMQKDMEAWTAREEALESAYEMIDFQADYIRELVQPTDYPKFDIELTVQEFKEWKKDKEKSIVGYRDKAFKSPVTGTMAPVHHTPWWDAMDDSMATFLASDEEAA
jgi:trimethylamine monooxygenase